MLDSGLHDEMCVCVCVCVCVLLCVCIIMLYHCCIYIYMSMFFPSSFLFVVVVGWTHTFIFSSFFIMMHTCTQYPPIVGSDQFHNFDRRGIHIRNLRSMTEPPPTTPEEKTKNALSIPKIYLPRCYVNEVTRRPRMYSDYESLAPTWGYVRF